MFSLKLITLASVTLFFFCSSATYAAITIDVTGIEGASETTWTFSGSATVENSNTGMVNNAITIDDVDGAISWGWLVGSDFYAGINNNIIFDSSSAVVTSNGETYNILGIGAEFTSPDSLFGIAIEDVSFNGTGYNFFEGQELFFFGSAMAPVSIDEFMTGQTNALAWHDNFLTKEGELAVQFNVTPTAVPEPSSYALILLGLSALFAFFRKK